MKSTINFTRDIHRDKQVSGAMTPIQNARVDHPLLGHVKTHSPQAGSPSGTNTSRADQSRVIHDRISTSGSQSSPPRSSLDPQLKSVVRSYTDLSSDTVDMINHLYNDHHAVKNIVTILNTRDAERNPGCEHVSRKMVSNVIHLGLNRSDVLLDEAPIPAKIARLIDIYNTAGYTPSEIAIRLHPRRTGNTVFIPLKRIENHCRKIDAEHAAAAREYVQIPPQKRAKASAACERSAHHETPMRNTSSALSLQEQLHITFAVPMQQPVRRESRSPSPGLEGDSPRSTHTVANFEDDSTSLMGEIPPNIFDEIDARYEPDAPAAAGLFLAPDIEFYGYENLIRRGT